MLLKAFRQLLSPILKISVIRQILVHYYYRNIIKPSEMVFRFRQTGGSDDEEFLMAELRKNGHLIDKGLQRSGWEPGHSSQAYAEAKSILSRLKTSRILHDPSVIWVKEIITDYENIRKSKNMISRRMDYQNTLCTLDSLLDAIHTRRSIRQYQRRPITEEIIKKIVDVINWSPTSCNRQTAKVFATNDAATVQSCLKLCPGGGGFGNFVPLFICFCSDIRAYEMATEVMMPYIDVSLGIQNCNLVAHTLGISMTLLSWAGHTNQQDRKLRQILGINANYEVIVNAVGGYPEHGVVAPSRKTIDSTLSLVVCKTSSNNFENEEI